MLAVEFEVLKVTMACMEVEITKIRATCPLQPQSPPRSPLARLVLKQTSIHASPIKASFSGIDEDMIWAIRELRKKFLEPEEDNDYYMRSQKEPLHPNILVESFPPNFRVPRVELYEGMTDPNDHINMFLARMVEQPITYALLYHLFPGTLKGTSFQ